MDWTDNYHALMKSLDGPQHPHDCKKCEFKGRFGKFDVYVCPKPNHAMDSLIARYGKEGNYFSMMRVAFAQAVSSVINQEVRDSKNALIENPKLSEPEMAILARVFSGKEE